MTVIVGIANGVNVWMGGDTAVSDNSSVGQYAHPKLFMKQTDTKHGEESDTLLIGGCGSPRMLQLLEHGLTVPSIGKNQEVIAWLTIEFVDAVRQLFKDKGYAKTSGAEAIIDGDFLIGIRGKLYHLYSDFQATGYSIQEDAAGSGYHYAIGSLHTSRALPLTPPERIQLALEAAADNNPFCSSPFNHLMI